MNKKTNKKKKRRTRNEYRNKENVDDSKDSEPEQEVEKESTEADCYEVKYSDVMGRYLVAARDMKAGEIIIREPTLAVGPCAGCGIICLGCYRELEEDQLYRCKKCRWPLCGPNCHGVGVYTGHSDAECQVLKGVKQDMNDLDDLREAYHALMPLRCLLLKSTSASSYASLKNMESHNALRRARGDIWPLNQRLVVDRLRAWGLEYDDEEVHTICGVLEVNSFEVGGVGANARALYARAALLAHGCVPTTTHTECGRDKGRPITLRAAVDHKKGDMFTASYAYTLQGTLQRRAHLLHSKFFSCSCERCADATELGSRAAALRCPRCSAAVLSSAPLLDDAHWNCVHCGYTISADNVRILIKRLTDAFDSIESSDVRGYEAFLHKYRNVICESHYLCLSAKHSLSQLYGKVSEYMIDAMPTSELLRKVALCRDLLDAFKVLEPGYSRLRGVTLYELHAPLMILTTRDFEKKAITKEELRSRLKEIVSYLSESALILGFEPPKSSEGLMASAARDALKKIKTWEQIIGKIS